ncbi:hypothetical protein [Roseiterribacter gracilis]
MKRTSIVAAATIASWLLAVAILAALLHLLHETPAAWLDHLQ